MYGSEHLIKKSNLPTPDLQIFSSYSARHSPLPSSSFSGGAGRCFEVLIVMSNLSTNYWIITG